MSDKLQLFSLAPHPVPLPNGRTAHLRRLTAAARLEWVEFLASSGDQCRELAKAYDAQAALLALTACDDAGARLFPGSDLAAAGAEVRAAMDEPIFALLSEEAFAINGVGDKAREDVKKKSGGTPDTSGSSDGSPSTSAPPASP